MRLSVDEILQQKQHGETYWGPAQKRYDNLIDVYHGNYQNVYPDAFRRGEQPVIANWIKVAWDRYARMVGKVPTHNVTPTNLSRKQQKNSDEIERVLAHYDQVSNINEVMYKNAWFLIGLGASCMGVIPDPVSKGPRFVVKDPRTVLPFPGAGSGSYTSTAYSTIATPVVQAQSMESMIINESVNLSLVHGMFPDEKEKIIKIGGEGDPLSSPKKLITYMDKEHWIVVFEDEILKEVEHNLGFVPFRYTTNAVPDQLGGTGLFEQNIGLVLSFMKVLNQKLTYNENLVWPWLVMRGLANVDQTNRVIEIMDRDGSADFLSPPAELQAERDLEMLDQLIRIMNHDTEPMRGESPSSVATGRGLQELNRDVSSTVQEYWQKIKPDIEYLKSSALILDEKLYGGLTKPMTGRIKGESFESTYTPSKVIRGQHSVSVDFGVGVGGSEGFVELMQLSAQGLIDEQTVMEQIPWIKSVSDTRRKIMMDRLETIIFEMTGGGQPTPITNHLIQWGKALEGGTDPWEWLTDNPIPEPEPQVPEGGPGMGGIPARVGEEGGPIPAPSPQSILQQLGG